MTAHMKPASLSGGRRRGLAVTVVFLLVTSAPGLHAAFQTEVSLADGISLSGQIDLPAFVVRTEYGFLTVPTNQILAVYPGFPVTRTASERVDTLITRLNPGVQQAAAIRELKRMGRSAIPALQKAVGSSNEHLSQQAREILRDIWPCLERVNPNGDAIVIAKAFIVRGQLTFRSLRVVTDAGPRVVAHDELRLIKFVRGDVPDVRDWPEYPDLGTLRPDVEAHLTDGSRIRGQLDESILVVRTEYGDLKVPLLALISIRPGTHAGVDEVTTRELLLRGRVQCDTFNISSKMGPLQLARDKIDILKVVGPEEIVVAVKPESLDPTPPTAEPQPAVSHDWQEIFNGKDLKGWRKWGPGDVNIAQRSIVMDGECGLTYEQMPHVKDVIISAEIKLIKPGITKLALRESGKGLYHVEFSGDSGTVARWDNAAKKNVVLKRFKFKPTTDGIYRMQFGARDRTLLAYDNGTKVADIELPDDKNLLGPGSVNVSIWQATSAFRKIEIKVLK